MNENTNAAETAHGHTNDLVTDVTNDQNPGETQEAANGASTQASAAPTQGIIERLRTLAEEVVTREGCKLYDLEFVTGSKGRGRTLRVYIEKEKELGGVGIEDCSNVSRGLNLILDVEDVIPGGAYTLEVSTPGLERLLRQLWHFKMVVGQRIQVKLNQSLEDFNPEGPSKVKNCKALTGELTRADDNGLEVNWDGALVQFPITAVHRAHVVFVPPEKEKPGKKHDKKKK